MHQNRTEAQDFGSVGQRLDDASARKLAEVLSHEKCGIVSLGLADADLDDAELAPILEQCAKSKTLKVLDVAGNGLGGATDTNGASALAVMRSSSHSETKPHDKKAHHTSGSIGDSKGWARSKRSFLDARPELKKKVAQSKVLGGVAVGLELLTKNGCGCLELIACLGASSSLTHVDLSWNRIGERDGAVFSALLRNNTTLENVSMGFNALGDVGLQHLATCLIHE